MSNENVPRHLGFERGTQRLDCAERVTASRPGKTDERRSQMEINCVRAHTTDLAVIVRKRVCGQIPCVLAHHSQQITSP